MKFKSKRFNDYPSDRRGAMLPLIAVTMTILFVAAVISVDVARIHTVRSELRTATDAAARAAVESLARDSSEANAVQSALEIAELNLVAGEPLKLVPSKIVFGGAMQTADGSFEFTPKENFDPSDPNLLANSVRVVDERTGASPRGQVNMFFGGLFGVDTFEPVQSATATRLDRDIALVLDKSGSMWQDGRFDALIAGVDVFVKKLSATEPEEPIVVAEECRAANVVVHTITFSDGADHTAMQAVASHTGGTYIHAVDNVDLIEVFREMARQLELF